MVILLLSAMVPKYNAEKLLSHVAAVAVSGADQAHQETFLAGLFHADERRVSGQVRARLLSTSSSSSTVWQLKRRASPRR